VDRFRAMINLECLGYCAARGWASSPDKRLLKIPTLRGPMPWGKQAVIINVDQFGDDDSHPFLSAGDSGCLTITSLTPENIGVCPPMRDKVNAIDPATLLRGLPASATRITSTYPTRRL